MSWLLLVLMLAGCATIDPDYERPSVTVSTFRAIPVANGVPNFEIGLRVLNPNATPLELRGVSFSISLDGHKLTHVVQAHKSDKGTGAQDRQGLTVASLKSSWLMKGVSSRRKRCPVR